MKNTSKISSELKQAIIDSIKIYFFWPQYFIGEEERNEAKGKKYFYWGKGKPFQDYYLNRSRNYLRSKYPNLSSEQIDFIAGRSLTASWFPLIWCFKNNLKKLSIVFLLNYLLIILFFILYFAWIDSGLLFFKFIILLEGLVAFYPFIAGRKYFSYNAKRLSWEHGWSSFSEFKLWQDSLDKKIWWSIMFMFIMIIILLLYYLLNYSILIF